MCLDNLLASINSLIPGGEGEPVGIFGAFYKQLRDNRVSLERWNECRVEGLTLEPEGNKIWGDSHLIDDASLSVGPGELDGNGYFSRRCASYPPCLDNPKTKLSE